VNIDSAAQVGLRANRKLIVAISRYHNCAFHSPFSVSMSDIAIFANDWSDFRLMLCRAEFFPNPSRVVIEQSEKNRCIHRG
jgi:hypothetical protein